MEKRTLTFIVAVALVFFGIQFFFQNQNKESLKQWQEVQAAKKTQKIKSLEIEIQKRSTAATNLPLVELYEDQNGKNFLTVGVLDANSIVTLSWNEQPPHKVFSKKLNGTDSLTENYLTYAPQDNAVGPLIYRQGLPKKMPIGGLPDFGKYDLQIVFLNPKNSEKPFQIEVADYSDGHFSIPLEQIAKLKKEMSTVSEEISEPIHTHGIILRNTNQSYLPVGYYNSQTKIATYFEDVDALAQFMEKPEVPVNTSSTGTGVERFYVLENAYQQLVFSNYGGALTEINLPFKTDKNENSIVREIEFDRQIASQHPYNAHFPSHPYYKAGENPQGPYNEHIEGKLGGYYPLLRRDLIEGRGRKSVKLNPRFYALNIVSEYPEVAELIYEVKEFTQDKIVFETVQHHRRIKKTYSIAKEANGAPYCIDMTIEIEGDGRGLWLTSGIPEIEWISGGIAPALKYRISRNSRVDVTSVDLPSDAFINSSLSPDWICNSNGFFGIIMNPISEIDPGFRAQFVPGATVPSRLVEIDQDYQKFKPVDLPGYLMQLPLNSKGGTMQFHIFAGPFSDDVLAAVDNFYADPQTGYNPDFIACQSFHGWFAFISEPFADFLFILMKFFHKVTNSWAFSIILLTVALRLMLYPLNAWSMNSMLKMQQVSPEVTALQAKYKKDPKKAQLEIMNLYRERGINPMSGCLPMLIQLPFLIGMFDLLKSTFELRGASFIPGWIDNLAAPDVLFSWSTPIFFIGNQFHLLPFLLGAVMFLQQTMMSTLPKDKSLWTDQQRQQRTMGTMMTVVFTVFFYKFPSGLNIYWLSSMPLGILQQWWTQRNIKKN